MQQHGSDRRSAAGSCRLGDGSAVGAGCIGGVFRAVDTGKVGGTVSGGATGIPAPSTRSRWIPSRTAAASRRSELRTEQGRRGVLQREGDQLDERRERDRRAEPQRDEHVGEEHRRHPRQPKPRRQPRWQPMVRRPRDRLRPA